MAYANDRLYNEVIRKMMARLASDVKARELMLHLSCLTLTDMEEIEAKRETGGNYSAIMLLIDNLRRRENWPDHFINALRNCEQCALAAEIQDDYDRIRGINTQATASASSAPAAAATVTIAAALPLATTPMAASAIVITEISHSVPHVIPSLLTPEETPAQSPAPAKPPLSSCKFTQILTTSPSTAASKESKMPMAVMEGPILVKHPIQDTSTPGNQKSQNTSTINQHLERIHSAVPASWQAQPTSPTHVAAQFKDDTSKPGTLGEEKSVLVSLKDLEISRTITTESKHPMPVEQATSVPVYNNQVVKELFEKFSSSTTEHVSPSDHTACGNSFDSSASEALYNLSNGFPDGDTPFPNHPMEDHYESVSKSLQADTVRFYEISTMQNPNGQPLSVIVNAVQTNEEPVGLNQHSESLVQSVGNEFQPNQHNQGLINSSPSERREESQGVLNRFRLNPHFIAVAAFGLTAVFMAWKHK